MTPLCAFRVARHVFHETACLKVEPSDSVLSFRQGRMRPEFTQPSVETAAFQIASSFRKHAAVASRNIVENDPFLCEIHSQSENVFPCTYASELARV